MEKIYKDSQIGLVRMCRKIRNRRICIRVRESEKDGSRVTVTMPLFTPYSVAIDLLESRRQWILDALNKLDQSMRRRVEVTQDQIEEMRKKARKEIPPRVAELASRHGFVYNRLALKNNVSNWGSCSHKNNINLNIRLTVLPSALRDYVILHELCHLRHHDHGESFHILLESVCSDNLLRLKTEGDAYAAELLSAASCSRARYPVHHVVSKEMKKVCLMRAKR